MKAKDKINRIKAQQFVNKYQLGGSYDPFASNPFDYMPDLESAKRAQTLTPPLNQLNNAKELSAYPEKQGFNLDSVTPFISPAINLGIGVANIFKSFKEKSRQKSYERAYKKDLEQRMNQSRWGDFYNTPYSVPYYQDGGLYKSNPMEMFIDYYQTHEQQNADMQKQFEDYYSQKNEQMKQNWKNLQSSGFNSVLSGATSLLPMLQKGGSYDKGDSMAIESLRRKREIQLSDKTPNENRFNLPRPDKPVPSSGKSKSKDRFREHQEGGEYDPKQDLYSPEYEVPREVEDEISNAQIETKQDDTLMDWIFEDETPYNYEDVPDEDSDLGYAPIQPVVEYFKSMGLNPSSVDTGTHNVGSKHYEGKAVDLGLNTTFGGDLTKMYQFKQWFDTKGKELFPGLKLIDETKRPEGQQEWSGAHLHLQYD